MGFIRTLAGFASVVITVLCLVVLLPDCASACSCAALPGSQQEIAKRALSSSSAVFSGKVVEIDQPPLPLDSTTAPAEVTFRVSESWKGPDRGLWR